MSTESYTFPESIEHPAQTIARDRRCPCCERLDRVPPVRFASCVHMPCPECNRCLGCAIRVLVRADRIPGSPVWYVRELTEEPESPTGYYVTASAFINVRDRDWAISLFREGAR